MKLYLVGDEKSHKTNDWLAVCKTKAEAERLLTMLVNAVEIREVKVS